MSITIEQMRGKLLSLDEARNLVNSTEPLTAQIIDSSSKVQFELSDGWATSAQDAKDPDVLPVTMTINGTDHALTKEALFQAAANFGLSASYIRELPAKLSSGLLNYHYGSGMGSKAFSVFQVRDAVASFARPTLKPFSTAHLLENVVAGIEKSHGATEILVDSKLHHTLSKSNIRLVLPEKSRVIENGGMLDVPSDSADIWYAGIHLSNSVIGKGQTGLEAYLMRWWCLNGATIESNNLPAWDRRSESMMVMDVYEWAQSCVDEVLGGLESSFDSVQSLTDFRIAGNTGDILQDIFAEYAVPVSQRESIVSTLLEAETLTLYTVMQAITGAANLEGLDDSRQDRLMRIGGAIPTRVFDPVKDRIWNEGHSADPDAVSPYRVGA